MNTETYEVLALFARGWFIILIALTVLKGVWASVSDNRKAKTLRSWAGGAGCVGELVVLEDGIRSKKRSIKGMRLPVPEEGLFGSGGMADIRIRHSDVKRRHLWLTYQPGQILLTKVGRAQAESPVTPDGRMVLRDGDSLYIGRLKLMMVFYDIEDAAAARRAPVRRTKPGRKTALDEFEDHYEENFWE